ncbi:MAG: dihydrofolate reductase [Chitinophagaceae bacterium]|nr:dihydrofolate reductase [Chitinophagaceae bacterium]
MRKIIVATYLTMDGVLQAPGLPEEDPSNGFKWGGWMVNHWDEVMKNTLSKIITSPYDLLLGRRTYEIFASHWPYQNDEIGQVFARINKYVVATTPIDLSWKHSILINKDVINELKKLKKQDGPDLFVWGSSRLVQTLLANHLVDVLHAWTFPVTIGEGKKLFQEGTQAQQWKLTESAMSTTGVVMASYVPDGEVRLDSDAPYTPSEAELTRRMKWKLEEAETFNF